MGIQRELKIGAVAREAKVSVDSVRYYEHRGLLPPPRRLASGYRVYGDDTVERIRFMKHLQSLGFSLNDIGGVLSMVDAGTANCVNQQPKFEAVLKRIDAEISELKATRKKVAKMLKECQGGGCAWAGCG